MVRKSRVRPGRPERRGRKGVPAEAWWKRFKASLAVPVSGASLGVFRMGVGLVMCLEAWALCRPDFAAITAGTTPLETYYAGEDVTFHFPYQPFYWLPLLPAGWIYGVVAVLAVGGLGMAAGWCYRVSAAAVFLAWGYLFAVESTRTYWQSHYYLELLVTFLLIWMPAARRYSVDAWLARGRDVERTVPRWTLWLLRGQLVIAYFYAGVAKLTADWLLDAVPVRWFLGREAVTAPFAPYLTEGRLEWATGVIRSVELAYFISYVGLVFDLAVGFLLLVRRTRFFGLALMILFHATNHLVIFDDIGWFPILGIATVTIFLDPDWPERLWRWLRRPRLATPDWRWLVPGALLFPGVGATLGWKAAPPDQLGGERGEVGRHVALFVVIWLGWQALMPLRHYWIPGDGRFTYEGLSFSWRLKAETRHALGVQVFVEDSGIVPRDAAGRVRINWGEWRGDKVIYRRVAPGRIDWRSLPELVVVLEPVLGERLVYNPWAGMLRVRGEEESRERVREIWRELYGREPVAVSRSRLLSEGIELAAASLEEAGRRLEASELGKFREGAKQIEGGRVSMVDATRFLGLLRTSLRELQMRAGAGGPLAAGLKTVAPFVLEGERAESGEFLVIEDSALLEVSDRGRGRVDRALWRGGPHGGDSRWSEGVKSGVEPLVVHVGDLGVEAREVLPQACLIDSQDYADRPVRIYWNTLKDVTISKSIHISNQAFYLRRYARRVAEQWEEDYGRRPRVRAVTAVSLNGRPHQLLVDPEVDLASVGVRWMGHNFWIKDLAMRRIPREALTQAGGMIGR